jgi:hypothetical protein
LPALVGWLMSARCGEGFLLRRGWDGIEDERKTGSLLDGESVEKHVRRGQNEDESGWLDRAATVLYG